MELKRRRLMRLLLQIALLIVPYGIETSIFKSLSMQNESTFNRTLWN